MNAPPTPLHLLRSHLAPVNAVHFSTDNERLYSGDAQGRIVLTSTRSLRPLAQWQAHTDGILGVEEWSGFIITHGRDNKLHVWSLPMQESATRVGDSATLPGSAIPNLCYSMDVNALNYCRFSLMPMSSVSSEERALLALPNLVESSLADIWELPSQDRVHAAIGKAARPQLVDGRGINPIGIIMSMHLFEAPHPNSSDQKQLRLLCGYENGGVTMFGYSNKDRPSSIEGRGWDIVWTVKLHVESVMAMAVSRAHHVALTVSADHLIARYDILHAEAANVEKTCTVHRTKHPGNASIAIRDDGRVCAVGGWDGKIRLYSTKSLKSLGTLEYHKQNCQAAAFAHTPEISSPLDQDVDSDDEVSDAEKNARGRWLAVGSQDNRVSIWQLMSFEKTT